MEERIRSWSDVVSCQVKLGSRFPIILEYSNLVFRYEERKFVIIPGARGVGQGKIVEKKIFSISDFRGEMEIFPVENERHYGLKFSIFNSPEFVELKEIPLLPRGSFSCLPDYVVESRVQGILPQHIAQAFFEIFGIDVLEAIIGKGLKNLESKAEEVNQAISAWGEAKFYRRDMGGLEMGFFAQRETGNYLGYLECLLEMIRK